jgi:hypothetical protein
MAGRESDAIPKAEQEKMVDPAAEVGNDKDEQARQLRDMMAAKAGSALAVRTSAQRRDAD